MSDIQTAINKSIVSVTKSWKKAKLHDERVAKSALDRMRDYRPYRISIKDAAFRVMKEAYMEASANNTLPANARQIMYAARPKVLKITGGDVWKKSSYFTQTILNEYLRNPYHRRRDGCDKWDVVYDARGKMVEPHTDNRVDLGTLAVRRYVAGWQAETDDKIVYEMSHRINTLGPSKRFKYVLFIEKEGFNELFKAVHLADRYDLAIMSTKGMSVTAARKLVEDLSNEDVTILVLHDFDKSGITIFNTLREDTWRYKFEKQPNVVDLGLRLDDINELGLQSEPVTYGKKDPTRNLRYNGATEGECNYLVKGSHYNGRYYGERVELNAMTSRQLIDWLEKKLESHGVTKVIPDQDDLEAAFKRAWLIAKSQKAIGKIVKDGIDDDVEIPEEMGELIANLMRKNNRITWDDAVYYLASNKEVPIIDCDSHNESSEELEESETQGESSETAGTELSKDIKETAKKVLGNNFKTIDDFGDMLDFILSDDE